MILRAVRSRLGDERGFTLIELLMVCALLGFVLVFFANFVMTSLYFALVPQKF